VDALAVARDNAEQLGVAERTTWLQGDLFEPLEPGAGFDLVVANPPYVADAEWDALAPEIREHEPRLALLAGSDGLSVLRRLCARAPDFLAPGAALLVEVGAGQAEATRALMEDAGLVNARSHRDLSGIDRVVEARAPGA
jgi:release factor glutamine methyltransferase